MLLQCTLLFVFTLQGLGGPWIGQEPRPSDASTPASEVWVAGGVLVLKNGTEIHGRIGVDRFNRVVRLDDRNPSEWSARDVGFLTDSNNSLIYYLGHDSLFEAFEARLELSRKAAVGEMYAAVRATKSVPHMEQWIRSAEALGVDPKLVRRMVSRKEKLEKRPEKVHSGKLAEVERERADISEFAAIALTALVEGNDALYEKDYELWRKLIHKVLELQPSSPTVLAAIGRLIPPGLDLPPTAPASDGLLVLHALKRYPLVQIQLDGDVDSSKKVELEAKRQLSYARMNWRVDVVGYRSNRVVVITPVKDPVQLSRCLLLGELVCGVLAPSCDFGTVDRQDYPMTVWLAESRAEYLTISQGKNGDSRGLVTRSVGHFAPIEGNVLSKMYLPPGEDGFRQALPTLAHELTHHWMFSRCPLFTAQEVWDTDPTGPGAWVVEGFATMIEEFEFDEELWTLRATPGSSYSQEVVGATAGAPPLDWKSVFLMPKVQFEKAAIIPVKAEWQDREGRAVGILEPDALTCVYIQGGAACHYLWSAEGGKHRRALLEYLGHYYRGEVEELDIFESFGLRPAELGQRIERFAQNRYRRSEVDFIVKK